MSFHAPEKYRLALPGTVYASDASFGNNGCFSVPLARGQIVHVLCGEGLGWEHVSVSRKDRIPTWDEMCAIKAIFWDAEDCVVQFHPPESEYVNDHENVLHLWRPIGVEFPRPPKVMV